MERDGSGGLGAPEKEGGAAPEQGSAVASGDGLGWGRECPMLLL